MVIIGCEQQTMNISKVIYRLEGSMEVIKTWKVGEKKSPDSK